MKGARLLLIVGLATLHVGVAAAQCTSLAEAGALRHSLHAVMGCRERALRTGSAAPCTAPAPPSCAGSLVDDAVALAYGASNPAGNGVDPLTIAAAYRCQRYIGRAV